jgi:hypothetical protein
MLRDAAISVVDQRLWKSKRRTIRRTWHSHTDGVAQSAVASRCTTAGTSPFVFRTRESWRVGVLHEDARSECVAGWTRRTDRMRSRARRRQRFFPADAERDWHQAQRNAAVRTGKGKTGGENGLARSRWALFARTRRGRESEGRAAALRAKEESPGNTTHETNPAEMANMGTGIQEVLILRRRVSICGGAHA